MSALGKSQYMEIPYVALSVQLKAIEEELKTSNTKNETLTPEINISKLSHAIRIEIESGHTIDVNDYFQRMLKLYYQDEIPLKHIVRIIYQVVKELSKEKCPRGSKLVLTSEWAYLLVELLFSNSWSRSLILDVIFCLKIYSRSYNEVGIVNRLWHTLLENLKGNGDISITSTYVLIQFFDDFSTIINDFKDRYDIEQFISKLLLSDGREERKAALYLIKAKNYTSTDLTEQRFWISFITVLENLEENQSHLILPSLDHIKKNDFQKAGWKMWLDIIYLKILAHQNILVTRWALEYIIQTFSCSDISPNVLCQFVRASNNTSLYNYEGYFLPTNTVKQFLSGDVVRFVEIMAEVNLKSVPLHFWLSHIIECKSISNLISNKLLLKIAARVRVLQNPFIRFKCIQLCEDTFSNAISCMTMTEYIVLIESLYNITDPFNNFPTFCIKLKHCLENGDSLSLTERFYEIVTNNLNGELIFDHSGLKHVKDVEKTEEIKSYKSSLLNGIVDCLWNKNEADRNDLNWLLFMLVFELENPEIVQNICQTFWNLRLYEYIGSPYEVLSDEIISKLTCGKNTEAFVRRKFPDFFIKEYITDTVKLYNINEKIEDILTTGSHKTLLKVSKLLISNSKAVDECIIDTLLGVLKRFSRMASLCYVVTENLFNYFKNAYSLNHLKEYADRIIHTDTENIGICAAVLDSGVILKKETYIDGIMMGEINFGDARVEEMYCLETCERKYLRLHQLRLRYISSLPIDYKPIILTELLNKLEVLSSKKPRYFENSVEHRLKMRISNAVISLMTQSKGESTCSEIILSLLLNHNNQLNITYIYELLVAICISNGDIIFEKLNDVTKHTPSQQVSIISIVYCYIVLNQTTLPKDYRNVVINKLLPLTMGPHFQTRLYAQLVIYKILENSKCGVETLISNQFFNLQEAIALAIGSQLNELLNDVRLLLPHIYIDDAKKCFDNLMFITMAPVDEYESNLDFKKYETSRHIFSKKKRIFSKQSHTSEQAVFPSTNVINIQRKMNPESVLCTMSSIAEAETLVHSDMFVVASLIDKIPNIGGIARSCEVLGIRNLVLSSGKLTERDDFKSVSMTAEKNLNIYEVPRPNLEDFLKDKHEDGFNIIGAEQTVASQNLIGFTFPRKCVLVLGHEKEGIPSNILGFLDYTIEIPQFGLLRSLNVHVTGALFMWEYCKQHIVGSSGTTLL
uniref:Probable methyltransferase TARBP1 n=1 Tax=Zeugodacus cucurbitae TaxID=28588 RepID=A0A0A1WE94_ZEUCU